MKTVYGWMLSFTLCFLLSMEAPAQTVAFAELGQLQAIENRPVIVFIHTRWCRYCSAMKNSLLNNKSILELIKRKFFAFPHSKQRRIAAFDAGFCFE